MDAPNSLFRATEVKIYLSATVRHHNITPIYNPSILSIMKKINIIFLFFLLTTATVRAQGWPANERGVMLQGFYWDSFDATKWTRLEAQADELAEYFSLVWIPQSANCGGLSMGYDDLYWFEDYNSSFGTKAELLNLIATFRNKRIGTIADVVINHRKNVSNWVDFPAETYQGVTYQLLSTDICADDDNGATSQWAANNGYSLSSNNDTGEGWGGMRDLDHRSTNVQDNVKAYLSMLLNDFGYAGFRYDMVKGYTAEYTGMYNAHSQPTYSVGEYWDGNATKVKAWIDATKVNGVIQSAAFDFPFRYTVRDAINQNNWGRLASGGLATDKNYQRYAVTFVENHDTEFRSATQQQDPIRKDTLAANAYLLAMPGTPCVFLKHWSDNKRDIKMMINARRLAGITNTSDVNTTYAQATGYIAIRSEGERAPLLAVIGSKATEYTAADEWKPIVAGHHYRYLLHRSAETAWIDLPSGTYDGVQTAILSAVTQDASARLVYTIDGDDPTADSPTATDGSLFEFPVGTTTIKAALLKDGVVGDVVTRTYTVRDFQPYDITVYVNTDAVGWSNVNFWTWGGDGSHAPTNTSWPGDKMTATTAFEGKNWYAKSFRINTSDDYVNFVFSTGTGTPQTVDVANITRTTYFNISADVDATQGNKHKVEDVTASTGISIVPSSSLSSPTAVYTLDGRMVRPASDSSDNPLQGLDKGIYIVNGKKYVVK